MSKIILFHDYKTLSFPEQKILKAADIITDRHKVPVQTKCNGIFCSDYKIKKLNNKYLGRNCPTDVLAFPFNDDNFLGEIYVSLQRGLVQSRRYNNTFEKEVTLLFIHGLLHLLGYDHETETDQKEMRRLENYYCDIVINQQETRL